MKEIQYGGLSYTPLTGRVVASYSLVQITETLFLIKEL